MNSKQKLPTKGQKLPTKGQKLPTKGHKISEVSMYNSTYKGYWENSNGTVWSMFFTEHIDERADTRAIAKEEIMLNIALMFDALEDAEVFQKFTSYNGKCIFWDNKSHNVVVVRAFAEAKEVHLITVYKKNWRPNKIDSLIISFEDSLINFTLTDEAKKTIGRKSIFLPEPIEKI